MKSRKLSRPLNEVESMIKPPAKLRTLGSSSIVRQLAQQDAAEPCVQAKGKN